MKTSKQMIDDAKADALLLLYLFLLFFLLLHSTPDKRRDISED
jgi:hypothetical protein